MERAVDRPFTISPFSTPDDVVVDEYRSIAIAVENDDIRHGHGGKVETRLAMEGERS